MDDERMPDEQRPRPARDVTRRLMAVTLAQAAVVLLAGLNLNLRCMAGAVGGHAYVRWRELAALGLLVPLGVALLGGVFWILEAGRRDAGLPLSLLVVGVGLLGVAMGVHEPLNVLAGVPRRMASSVWFWDEVFSHAAFFLAFAGLSLVLMWSQTRNPLPEPMSRNATLVFAGIALLGGAGIFLALLPGGPIVWDLTVMAAMVGAAEALRRGGPFRRLPVAILVEWPCILAGTGLIVQRIIAGRWS